MPDEPLYRARVMRMWNSFAQTELKADIKDTFEAFNYT